MAAGSPTNSPGARVEDRVSWWSISSNVIPLGTMNPARYTTARSRSGTCSATAEIVIPPAECPTRMTLPSPSDAASFTSATTACVRSSCVTPAMADRSAANAAGSNGLHLSDVGAIAFIPAPGRSSVRAAKPLALSIGVTLSHTDWLCQPPWIRTKTALGGDIAEPSSFDFTIFTTCLSGRPPFRCHLCSPSPGFAQHQRTHNRVQARQLKDLREIGFHTRIAAHRLYICGGLPLGVDDHARAVLCRDQPGRLPAVERADDRVGVLPQERDQRILLPGFDLQQIDQNNGLVGHGISPSVSDTPRTTRRVETDRDVEDFFWKIISKECSCGGAAARSIVSHDRCLHPRRIDEQSESPTALIPRDDLGASVGVSRLPFEHSWP